MAEEEEGLLSMTSSANLTVNPFDTVSLDSMHLPAFSPSVFQPSQDTPCSKKKGGFRWSIDQMSLLYPADIDELPRQQDASFIPKEKEEEVQEAINQFFSQKVVVPSPWSQSKPMKQVTFSPKPPSVSILSEHSAENSLCSSTNGSFLGNVSGKVDVSCQTAITLPLNFDLEAFLGKGRFMYTKSSVESFPVAPLRRKLFTQSESSSNGLPSASPLSASSRESGPFSPSISPIKSSQECSPGEYGQIPKTPSSVESQFSSSPIARFRTTPLRPVPHVQHQASPLSGKMESPSMSPIREVPQDTGLPPSPIAHTPVESLSNGDHISPLIIKGKSLYQPPRPSENMMETSLSKAGILDFRPQMADVGRDREGKEGMEGRTKLSPNSRGTSENEREREEEMVRRQESLIKVFDGSDREEEFDHGSIEEFDGNVGEELMERRKDFSLGLTRELSPIQKIGDHISTLDEPGCSSRLHGTQEESSMDTSLMSNRGQLRENTHASSPPRKNIPCDFSLEASTALSPIPKTGDLPLSLPLSPVRTGADETKDGVEIQSFRPKGRHKMVSFHIGTEFSPIRCAESGSDHILGQTLPITSSRVHESNTELLMETSLFSWDGQEEAEGDRSERVENLRADIDAGGKRTEVIRTSPLEDIAESKLLDNVSEGTEDVHEEQEYLESSRDELRQQFVKTAAKDVMKRDGMNHPLSHECKDDSVSNAADVGSQHLHANPKMFWRTSSIRDGAASTCCRSYEPCDHSSACWVADSNSSSLKHEAHLGERSYPLQSPMVSPTCLTSTMRYGTPSVNPPFGLPARGAQSATPSMDFSSVSLIANASSTKETVQTCEEVDHSTGTTSGRFQQEPSKNLRFDEVQFYERVEDCRMQTSFRKSVPCSMTTSRSYDSLQKYAEEKENTSVQEDWLMTSLSEADLQSHRSSELQEMVPCGRDSVGTTPASSVQRGENKLCAAVQQGHNSHPVFQRSSSDPLQEAEMQEGSNSFDFQPSHPMEDMQEGSMSVNNETPNIGHATERGSLSRLCVHQKLYLNTNVQEGHISRDISKTDVTPLRPISVNLLAHVTRTGVDSGYNTHSANVSMDIGDVENSS